MTPFSQDVIDAVVAVADAAPLERPLALAVVSVETRGIPFESDGTPSFLCEPATFWKELPPEKRASAVAAGIAAAKWSRDGYRDQGTEVGRRARLQRMIAVDERAAYRSISMGLPKAMGFYHSLCGYPDAKAMFEAFHDLAAQARALIALLPALGACRRSRRTTGPASRPATTGRASATSSTTASWPMPTRTGSSPSRPDRWRRRPRDLACGRPTGSRSRPCSAR